MSVMSYPQTLNLCRKHQTCVASRGSLGALVTVSIYRCRLFDEGSPVIGMIKAPGTMSTMSFIRLTIIAAASHDYGKRAVNAFPSRSVARQPSVPIHTNRAAPYLSPTLQAGPRTACKPIAEHPKQQLLFQGHGKATHARSAGGHDAWKVNSTKVLSRHLGSVLTCLILCSG